MSIFSDITGSLFGGGGAAQPTSSTAYNTNIPEYAKPYVETMLGATQKQLFQGNTDESGNFNITGFKPYQAYGGTYDQNETIADPNTGEQIANPNYGKQTSYDPSKAVAGFSPMQQKAQQGIAGLQNPYQYNQAQDVTNMGIAGVMGTAGQANNLYGMGNQAANLGASSNPQNFQSQVGGYMNPYMQQVLAPQMDELRRQYDISGQQQNAQAVGAGAFGGSRQALQQSENQRNLGTAQSQALGQAYNNAFGAAQNQYNQGNAFQMQGLQNAASMYGQGIGAQQSAYNQAMQGGQQLANLGQQQLASQQGIYGLQNQAGAQQQAQQQQIINQSMTDYANAQQYPLMQLGTMSNMLRGLPMQAQTTNQYTAAPNALTQTIGAAGTAASLYNATKAEGGVIKSMASGGITSIPRYDVGGAIESDLSNMDIAGLQRELRESSSPRVKQMAQRLLAEKQMEQAPRKAGGGIIAFAEGDKVEELDGRQLAEAEQARDRRIVSDAEQLPPEGILMADATSRRAPKAEAVNPAGGLLGNATAGTLPNATRTPVPNDIVGNVQKDLTSQQATANKSIEDIMAERQAVRDKLGVGKDTAREDYRAEQMAERANLKDEAERQRSMRLAEFFASWGSTPGSTLSAGMSALKKSIPGMIDDTKEAKRLKRESDKVIYDIDHATRLEELGRIDEATAIKEKAATHAQAINKELLTYQSHKETNAAHVTAAEITANRMAVSSERTANLADKRGLETQRFHFQTAANEAKKAEANLEAQIAKEAKDSTAYTTAKRVADSNVRGVDKTLKQNAIDTVAKTEAGWQVRRDAAAEDLRLAKQQLADVSKSLDTIGKKDDNSGKGDAAPAERPPIGSYQR